MNSVFSKFLTAIGRRKTMTADQVSDTKLDRCLSTLDLTALGIGSTLGLGIYVLAGKVATIHAGPAVILSFLIAAIASVFAGLCYAEFGSRVPRAGSAYIYSYVTVGELIAFIIGWNLILEYVIGTASVARGYSGYLDSLANHEMSNYLNKTVPLHISWLADYPDFLSFGITFLLAVILAIGVKESSRFNNIFTALNLLVVLYVLICGAFKSDPHNWAISKSEIPAGYKGGDGGFFPFGFSGVMKGASMCFYGFVGFDCIATTGEEVKNPQRAIPISIVLSLFFIFLSYFGISTVLTLMVPYYMQDPDAPLTFAFEHVGWPVAKWVVAIGALAGLSTSLLGGMFPLPRVLYAMANDGLLFRFLANIHPRFKTPVIASLLSGLLAASMAALFDLTKLIEMMSIGTLLAYTLVAASILILRYSECHLGEIKCLYFPLAQDVEKIPYTGESESSGEEIDDNSNFDEHQNTILLRNLKPPSARDFFLDYFNCDRKSDPTPYSATLVTYNVMILGLLVTIVGALITFAGDAIMQGKWWVIALTTFCCVLLFVVVLSIALQPQSQQQLNFRVPCVPVIPVLSIFVNVYLMLNLSVETWKRFGIWMAIGFFIYFLYGIRESSEEYRQNGEIAPNDDPDQEGNYSFTQGCICGRRRIQSSTNSSCFTFEIVKDSNSSSA